ncbi:MAG: hypothetical protein HQK83_15990 [Fibrobacteria bacterium]|nr:hypothetical protein [Fibrobacteria bacterium]
MAEKFNFKTTLENNDVSALSATQLKEYHEVFRMVSESMIQRVKKRDLPKTFVIPFLKAGLNAKQIVTLLYKIPEDWPWSHQDIYYDFRLERWIKHIEPLNLEDCIKEYLDNALSIEEGADYIKEMLNRLFKERKNQNC